MIKVLKLLFLLCLSKKSKSMRYLFSVFCCQGFVGSVFSTHALSNQAHFFGKAKTSACAMHSFKSKSNVRHKKLLKLLLFFVLMNDWCLFFSLIYQSDTPPLIPHSFPASLDATQDCHTPNWCYYYSTLICSRRLISELMQDKSDP